MSPIKNLSQIKYLTNKESVANKVFVDNQVFIDNHVFIWKISWQYFGSEKSSICLKDHLTILRHHISERSKDNTLARASQVFVSKINWQYFDWKKLSWSDELLISLISWSADQKVSSSDHPLISQSAHQVSWSDNSKK